MTDTTFDALLDAIEHLPEQHRSTWWTSFAADLRKAGGGWKNPRFVN